MPTAVCWNLTPDMNVLFPRVPGPAATREFPREITKLYVAFPELPGVTEGEEECASLIGLPAGF